MGDPTEVRERARVPVEEARLVLAWIEPCVVAARVHQPHHEHVRLASDTVDVDEHLEEVDLAEVTRLVHERDEHLPALSPPLVNDLLHDGVSDLMAFATHQRVQARCRQSLLAAGPALRVLEDLLDAALDCVAYRRAGNASRLADPRWCATQVAPDRVF